MFYYLHAICFTSIDYYEGITRCRGVRSLLVRIANVQSFLRGSFSVVLLEQVRRPRVWKVSVEHLPRERFYWKVVYQLMQLQLRRWTYLRFFSISRDDTICVIKETVTNWKNTRIERSVQKSRDRFRFWCVRHFYRGQWNLFIWNC